MDLKVPTYLFYMSGNDSLKWYQSNSSKFGLGKGKFYVED